MLPLEVHCRPATGPADGMGAGCAQLAAMRAANPRAKALVFTQFSQTLEWLTVRLGRAGYKYRTITGSMPISERREVRGRAGLFSPTVIRACQHQRDSACMAMPERTRGGLRLSMNIPVGIPAGRQMLWPSDWLRSLSHEGFMVCLNRGTKRHTCQLVRTLRCVAQASSVCLHTLA